MSDTPPNDEVAALRREVAELKEALREVEKRAVAAAAAAAAVYVRNAAEMRGEPLQQEPPPGAKRRDTPKGPLWLVPATAAITAITEHPVRAIAVVLFATGLFGLGILWPDAKQPDVIAGPTHTVTQTPAPVISTATPTPTPTPSSSVPTEDRTEDRVAGGVEDAAEPVSDEPGHSEPPSDGTPSKPPGETPDETPDEPPDETESPDDEDPPEPSEPPRSGLCTRVDLDPLLLLELGCR